MPADASSPTLLTLHAVRLLGHGDDAAVARRFALERGEVAELLLDLEAYGWVTRVTFARTGGWTLTDAGRAADEQLLAEELAATGHRETVADAHTGFAPLNARFLAACTHWQIRPTPGRPLALNDHTDYGWDARVVDELVSLGRRLGPLAAGLAARLARFDGYADRYADAVTRVERGEVRWVDSIDVDSCHRVWFELHEDLLATLGLQRGEQPAPP